LKNIGIGISPKKTYRSSSICRSTHIFAATLPLLILISSQSANLIAINSTSQATGKKSISTFCIETVEIIRISYLTNNKIRINKFDISQKSTTDAQKHRLQKRSTTSKLLTFKLIFLFISSFILTKPIKSDGHRELHIIFQSLCGDTAANARQPEHSHAEASHIPECSSLHTFVRQRRSCNWFHYPSTLGSVNHLQRLQFPDLIA